MMSSTIQPGCEYCGAYHTGMCGRIEEIEYYSDGRVKRVRLRAEPTVSVPVVVYPYLEPPYTTTWAEG